MELEAKDLILSLPGAEAFMCDVSSDAAIAGLFRQAQGALRQDCMCWCTAWRFAPAEELKSDFDFVNTTREGFRVAHDVSVYSLIAVCRGAAPLMADGGSVITMTYYGAEKLCRTIT
jgi:enoyl-[acyl-carrier protein] reductase I